MSAITRRALLRTVAWPGVILGVLVSSGCGGSDESVAKNDSVPSGPIKPVPKKKGVGKNQLEPPFDPRELLKKKAGG